MKKLLSVVAAALVALTFVGCLQDEDGVNWNTYVQGKKNKIGFYAQIQPNATLDGEWDFPDTVFFVGADDEKKAVTGADNKYKVNYTNPDSAAYRAYKVTALKHAGALIKITFKAGTTAGEASKMGVMFDIKDSANKDAVDMYVIGVGAGDKSYYVSKFTNVTDIQRKNFGADKDYENDNPAGEIEIEKWVKNNFDNLPAADADGNTSVWVYYKLVKDGSFDWAILNMTDEQAKDFKGEKKFNAASKKLSEYGILKSGNTKEKAGAEYEEAPITKVKATDLL